MGRVFLKKLPMVPRSWRFVIASASAKAKLAGKVQGPNIKVQETLKFQLRNAAPMRASSRSLFEFWSLNLP